MVRFARASKLERQLLQVHFLLLRPAILLVYALLADLTRCAGTVVAAKRGPCARACPLHAPPLLLVTLPPSPFMSAFLDAWDSVCL